MNQHTLGKFYLVGLFAVFFGPLFYAMWLFYGPNTWLNDSANNHGFLIQPPHSLNDFKIKSADGETWSHEDFLGKWTLLYIGDENCDLYCEASLFKMRQVRLTLGRDSQRVQRKFLGKDNQQDKKAINAIFENYSKMKIAWFKSQEVAQSVPYLDSIDIHQIYLIDPLGNVMMCYNKEATAKGMQKDLKRLLKVSKIG